MAIVGIDLGTTNSVITTMEHGRVEVLHNLEGKPTTPSVIFFESSELDDVLVGESAMFSLASNPTRAVRFIKRRMGQDFTVKIDDKEYTPEQLSSAILKKLIRDAEEYLGGDKVTDAVVTVPAWFTMRERDATKKAAELAGLKVRSLCPEPIAAAIDFAQTQGEKLKDKTVMVYDLGGGTFDVTVMKVEQGTEGGPLSFTVLGKGGSIELGGAEWDSALASYVAQDFASANGGKTPEDDLASFENLLARCQAAKETLSHKKADEATTIACTHDGITHSTEISRAKFEEITLPLLNQTIDKSNELVQQTFGENGWEKVDMILLAGGSTKMPAVIATLTKLSGQEPRTNRGVDLNVGRGAAYLAFSPDDWTEKEGLDVVVETNEHGEEVTLAQSIRQRGPAQKISLEVADVASESIGIEVVDNQTQRDINHILIKQGSAVGEEVVQSFGIYENGQTGVDLIINAGDTNDLNAVEKVAQIRILGLPSSTRRGEEVRVKMMLNTDGLIIGEATHVASGITVPIEVKVEKKAAAFS